MKYQPHDYQNYATQFIIDHPVAAILLQMGLGKSVITLTAIQKLLASREVYRVLVIAPLRVARDTWPAEIQKWDHLRGLTYSVAVGTEAERRAALMLDANIHIINRENVQWLIENSHIPFEYDMIVIDELSSFKSHQSKRFKSLMKQRHRVRRIVGLTGTPSSNGLMDLFAEYKLLDINDAVEVQVRSFLSKLASKPREELLQMASARNTEMYKVALKQAEKEYENAQKQVTALEEEAVKALTGESALDLSVINTMIIKHRAKRDAAAQTIEEARARLEQEQMSQKETQAQIDEMLSWADCYDKANIETRHMIIARIIEKVEVRANRKIHIKFRISLDQFLGKSA